MGLSFIVACASLPPSLWAAFRLFNGLGSLDFWLALWVALVGFTVAFCSSEPYCSKTTWLLGKSSQHGTVPVWSFCVFAPYHLGLRIKLWAARKLFLTSEPLYNKVLPGWFIGGWPSSPNHLPPGRPSVLDLTCELPKTHTNRYMCIPVWDTRVPSLPQIDEGVDWALKEYQRNGAVYVHCAHGHGRSAMLLSGCLMKSGEASSLDHALAMMTKVRPLVKLSNRQRRQMEKWAELRTWQQAQPKNGRGASMDVNATAAGAAPGLRRVASEMDTTV
uniref:Tyrosine specific protein phosphatases domain-containing protein n=1 Tax=Dunaliella tertiolecta TaxID=3047 RepID=A0A7S3QR65_DUNTE|mmetsp:Transcript_18657/g.52450  ORF Transcript_18657/g.52450 Transcript_18657/m.52450 type:complete len:275 (+) Transcript_18657:255-1079(+)